MLKFSFPISCEIKGNVALPSLEQNPVWRFRQEDLIFHREEPQEQNIPVSDTFDFTSNENNSIRGTVQLMRGEDFHGRNAGFPAFPPV